MNKLHVALALAVGASLPSLQAATEFEDSVPLELARIFLGVTHVDGGLYSDIAEGFPAVAFPAVLDVLGTVERPPGRTLYLRSALGEQATTALISDLYVADGWLRLTFPGGITSRNGFIGNMPMAAAPTTLCHDALGNLTVGVSTVSGFTLATLSTAQYMVDPQQTCAQIQQSYETMNQSRGMQRNSVMVHIPRLELPEEAVFDGRITGRMGSLGTSGEEVQASTPLQIDWSLDAIHSHFASQIEAQGWQKDNSWSSSLLSGSSWTHSPEDGVDLLAVFTVMETAPGRQFLSFRALPR